MDVLELQNSQESTGGGVYFFYEIALSLFAVCKFIKKEALIQLSSYEFCKIFKKTVMKNIFERLLPHNLQIFLFYYFAGRPIFHMELGRGVWEEGVISLVWYRF